MKRHPQQVIIPAEFRDLPFRVYAGKYDDSDRNCKYAECFATFEEAFAAYKKVSSYPWAELNMSDVDGALFSINLDPVMKESK